MYIKGDTPGCFQGLVDITTKIVFLYKLYGSWAG